ncbi:MAG: hypothetical protein HYY96_00010 [Candidatus Tectomicrobia bacterium]|nr:hypothetical protein [Candidatus Tectomicrobia bacterium]
MALLVENYGSDDIVNDSRVSLLMDKADSSLADGDYLILSRLLSIIKLAADFAHKRVRVNVPDWLIHDLFAPFVLKELRQPNLRWTEIDEYFNLVRRLAYLNQDTVLVESPILVGLSPLLSNLVDPKGMTSDALMQSREILVAYEHMVFERFYHRAEARQVAAVVAWRVFCLLKNEQNPERTIVSWMYDHRLSKVRRGKLLRRDLRTSCLIGSISLRSFFPSLPGSIYDTEEMLTKLLTAQISRARDTAEFAVGGLQYVPLDSQHAIEPAHIYVDVYVLGKALTKHVGRLMRWVTDKLDSFPEDPQDDIFWMAKPELEQVYKHLIGQLVKIAWPECRVDLKPWALTRLGKFQERGTDADEVCIWLSASNLQDGVTRHIVRSPRRVQSGYESLQHELHGVAQLRNQLQKSTRSMQSARPRRRYFLITASIRLIKTQENIEHEFDGGILQLSARTGAAYLYLLETKSGGTPRRAANELKRKLTTLGMKGKVAQLKKRSAYVKITL